MWVQAGNNRFAVDPLVDPLVDPFVVLVGLVLA